MIDGYLIHLQMNLNIKYKKLNKKLKKLFKLKCDIEGIYSISHFKKVQKP